MTVSDFHFLLITWSRFNSLLVVLPACRTTTRFIICDILYSSLQNYGNILEQN